jgi:two-component system alkaline phosphatase synthesis response regulator PhoP
MPEMPRILVVEDEPDIAFGLKDDLKVEGYEVDIVRDGVSAARRARDESWDLILLDVMLPRKDGFEVCRELRRSGVRTPIIILTAKTHEAEKVLGLDLGADDYVTKPFSPRELRARIKAALRRSAENTPDIYRFGRIEVNFTRAELCRRGKPVEITTLELRIMEAFIRNRGRIMSRNQLLEAAWGRDTFVTDRVVDHHIVNLRRKIEPQPETPRYLISVRGMGYRFDG